MTSTRQLPQMLILLSIAAFLGSACQPFQNGPTDEDEENTDAETDRSDAPDSGSTIAGSGLSAGAGGSTSNGVAGRGAAGSPDSVDADGGKPAAINDGLACGDSVPGNAKTVGGRVTGAVVWSGVIHINDDFTLRETGTKLTIEAGTQVFVDSDRFVEIGWNSSQHAIDAQGTEQAPIRFCRSQKTGGNWRGIDIGGAVLSSSALKHVVIEGAGKGADALVLRTGILIDHVWVRESAGNGVSAGNFRDDSTHLTVTTSGAAPLVLTDAWAVQRLPAGGTFTGNTEDIVHLKFANVTVGTKFRAIGIPYQLDVGLSLRTGGTLTVDPGVEWRVGIDQLIEFGWNSSQVELHIDGTEAEPVVIRGADVRAGSWRGAVVQGGVFATSTIKHVKLMHGGGDDGTALALNAPITISDIAFKDNAHESFFIGGQGLAPGSARFTVAGTKGSAGRVAPDALTSLPAGGSYIGNQLDYIEVTGGNITRTGTIPEVDVPLRVMGGITVRNAAVLTVAPGVEFHMQNGFGWDVGWNGTGATLNFVGTAAKPIKFRGINDVPGFWNGILVESSVVPSSRLEYVQIGNGSASGVGGNLRLDSAVTVTNCKLYGSTGYGIVAAKGLTQDYENLNTFEGNAMGNVQRL